MRKTQSKLQPSGIAIIPQALLAYAAHGAGRPHRAAQRVRPQATLRKIRVRDEIVRCVTARWGTDSTFSTLLQNAN
jgi:hypothetical protein